MSKIVLLQHREQKIIEVVMSLLENQTVFELKMSDVAKATCCSMGVIYSHFPSKEDLLLACVYNLIEQELGSIKQLLTTENDALDQILMASIAFWMTAESQPNNYTLKQFAINPHVWNAATITRVNAVSKLINEFSTHLHDISHQLFNQSNIGTAQDDADQFMLGLFGLTIGLYQQHISEFGGIIKLKCNTGEVEQNHYKLLLIRYLHSWGIDTNDIYKRFERLNNKTRNALFLEQKQSHLSA
ncbi:TetR/AcrR family transcriptional regulator [Vibrio comitans]|uniref:HTH tetR-type domain-containing protein n=1 Tax=Vibrio comitans NBRC 102076 TaxID=1219078 RepID=A0A4Y3IPI0_9VIBR|nr:TetR/AcrR family transcriptional regulator [Vibrio comitans]GEA61167.1 hypothetical protein VCO01S_23600 [Vibrio comitans NBRC 102076]